MPLFSRLPAKLHPDVLLTSAIVRPARIYVFIPTHRRPVLLQRALASLLAQTWTDWRAEVHNDDPADPAPSALVARLADPRISCVTHPRNLGALASFNLAYAPGPEPFVSILEDDNAWEPSFLERLHAILEQNSGATLAWCNQYLDEELADGSIRITGRTAHPWPVQPDSPRLVHFGEIKQAFGAVHANGSMLLRRRPGLDLLTPATIPFASVESYRERLLPYPLVFLPEPLARFTVTRASARTGERPGWIRFQVALAASFARVAGPSHDAGLWSHARAVQPSLSTTLIQAGLADAACRRLLRHATLREWFYWGLGTLRHPRLALAALRCRHAEWWPSLAAATAALLSPSSKNP